MTTGEYLFSHRRGDELEPGKHRIWCQYRPSEYLYKHYKFGYSSIPFEVGARAPKMYWPEIPPISYLTPLSTRQLKAMVDEQWPVEPVLNSPATLPPNHTGRGWGVVKYDQANDNGKRLSLSIILTTHDLVYQLLSLTSSSFSLLTLLGAPLLLSSDGRIL